MPESEITKQLKIFPIPPDSIVSAKQELRGVINQALEEAGKQSLLENKEFQLEEEQTFPVEGAILVGLTFLSKVALETYKEIILPKLKERFDVREIDEEEQED